ncbi:uncharacterized protein L199_006795 [Kwoniella botswanensis]|uniref:uncharacterized protein n=1 Tax=Kwoniella botswanensis TaxID=1268659 RepID=UPI00315C8F15
MFSKTFISLFALTLLTAIPISTLALPTGESDSEPETVEMLVSSVLINFGEHTAHLPGLNTSERIHNGSDTIASLAMGKSIGNEHSFYFYTYDDANTTLTQNLTCTYKTLKASENQAQYNLTNVIPLKPVSNNTDVASLRCVTSSVEVYNSNNTNIQ